MKRRKLTWVVGDRLPALVLACALGALAGLTVGASAGVLAALASLVPAIALDAMTRRRAGVAAREEEMDRLLAEYETPRPALIPEAQPQSSDLHEREVALLLRPENKIVEFWPRSELDALLEWCQTGEPVGISLVTGAGGSGKTRLALQLCEVLRDKDWLPLWVRPGGEYKAVSAAISSSQPCILVVDYAETRDSLAQLIQDAVSAPSGPTVRIILLARSAGKWWQDLISTPGLRIRGFLDQAHLITLRPLASDELARTIFDNALTAFAHRFQVAVPKTKLALAEPNTVFLIVHAAALLAVLDESTGTVSREPRSVSDVLEGILQHEAGYWTGSARKHGLHLDHAVFRLIVALQSLVGARNQAETADLLTLIPDLADSAERRWQAARWANEVYPVGETSMGGSSNEWAAPLLPDAVADYLIVSDLAERPHLIRSLFERLDQEQALHAFTVLVRSAHTRRDALGILKVAFTANPMALDKASLWAASELNSVIIQSLQDTLFTIDHPIGRRARSGEPSYRLPAAQRRAMDALAAINDGMAIQRRLATGQLDTLLPDLAAALTNQARCFANLGRWNEASSALSEAINIYRLLAAGHCDGLLPGLSPEDGPDHE